MKVCSRCHIEKQDGEFRLRFDKKGKGSRQRKYLTNICKACESEISNQHYFKNKDNPEFHREWVQKSRDYYHKHKDEIKEKMKAKRQTPAYKEMMKVYREKRKDIIYQQEVVTKRRYHEKHRDKITDKYIIGLLRTAGIEPQKITRELIEIKRSEVLLHRIKDKVLNRKIGETKRCSKCGDDKDLSEFLLIKNKQGKRVRAAHCRKCGSEKCKEGKSKRKNESSRSDRTNQGG